MTLLSHMRAAKPLVRRLMFTNFFMQIGHQAAYFVGLIGSATYVLGADAYGIAVLVATINASYVVGSGAIGVFVDRHGPRFVLQRLLICCTALALIAFIMPLAYPSLVLIAAVDACLAGAVSTTVSSFPPYLTSDPEQLKDANSLIDTAVHMAFIVGPAAGGAIGGALGPQAVFGFTTTSMAVAAACASTLQEVHTPPRAEEPSRQKEQRAGALAELREGARLVLHDANLRFLFLAGFFGFFSYGAFDSLESLFYRDVLRVSVEWMGYLSMCAGIGSVVGSIVLLRIPAQRVNNHLLVIMLLVTGLGTILYVGTHALPVAALGQVITGLGFGLMMPIQHMLTQRNCELTHLGRVNGIMRVGLNSSGVLPLIVSPFLAEVIGVQGVLVSAGVLVVLIASALALSLWFGKRG